MDELQTSSPVFAHEKAKEDSERREVQKKRKRKTEVVDVYYEKLHAGSKNRFKYRRVTRLKNGNKYRVPCSEPSLETLKKEKAIVVSV